MNNIFPESEDDDLQDYEESLKKYNEELGLHLNHMFRKKGSGCLLCPILIWSEDEYNNVVCYLLVYHYTIIKLLLLKKILLNFYYHFL